MLFLGTLLILLGMTIVPATNANNIIVKEKNTYQTLNNSDYQTYKLLIISPALFSRALKPLERHKEKYGISTYIATLDEIYEQMYWYGRDNAEKVKYYIKSAIENWGIEYVLLVGGKIGQLNKWYCPVRYASLGNDWEHEFLTDLYFADIYDSEGEFSSWDSDCDGFYSEWMQGGEPEDIKLDLYPDIAIGRLPCRNIFEVVVMVRKIIKYETTTYDKSWFKNMIAFAGDTYPEYKDPLWVGYEGEYYADLAFENMTGFNHEKYYTSDGTLSHWRDIIKALNKGCGFVYFNGHASPLIWTNHLPNSSKRIPGLTTFHMLLLRNGNKLPVCVVGGCHNNQFDVSILKTFDKKASGRNENIPECWSWVLTNKIGGGTIATIGCTALGHTKEDKESFIGGGCEMEVQFFKQYGQNNVDILGDTWAASIKWYIDKYPVDWDGELTNDSWVDAQVVQTWTLFGDPTLKIGGYPPPASKDI